MTAQATGGVGQAGLIERGHLDQFWKFDPLDQQLRDPIAAPNHDRLNGVEVDQCHFDLAAVPGVYRAGTVDDRESNARSKTGSRMNQAHHPVRDRNGDAGGH